MISAKCFKLAGISGRQKTEITRAINRTVKQGLSEKEATAQVIDGRIGVVQKARDQYGRAGRAYAKTAERWRSQMVDHLKAKLPGSGNPKQILQTLESWAKKGQIKAEELEWSGLREFLNENTAMDEINPDLWDDISQEYPSDKTSINEKKTPALHTWLSKEVKKGNRNIDIGGGKFDNVHEAHAKSGAENLVYDPFNRNDEHNQGVVNKLKKRKADTATIANVLNVIKEKENRVRAIQQAHNALKDGGTLYVSVYKAAGDEAGTTTEGSWQNRKPLKWYLPEVQKVFPNAKIQAGKIVATKTKAKPKVTKQDILDYLEKNHVQIEEVVKGAPEEDGMLSWDAITSIDEDVWMEYLDTELDYDMGKMRQAEVGDIHEKVWELIEEGSITASHMLQYQEEYGVEVFDHLSLPKYETYKTEGGKGYKEILLTMPVKRTERGGLTKAQEKRLEELQEKSWKSEDENEEARRLLAIDNADFEAGKNVPETAYTGAHWDEPNVLAHIRMQEVTDKGGKKTLLIEEIQSDWHQEGRKKGYIKTYEQWLKDKGDRSIFKDPDYAKKRYAQYLKNAEATPDAPFKKTWPILAFKRMVRYAAENGYDQIAWTPGEVQADRYDLSKQVDKITWAKKTDGTYDISVYPKDNPDAITKDGQTQAQLEDFIGKDITEKIVTAKGDSFQGVKGYDSIGDLEGIDLKVGGEGMKAFYDKMLPSAVKKFFGKKAWGSPKVGTTEMGSPTIFPYETISGEYVIKDHYGDYLTDDRDVESSKNWSKHQEDAQIFDTKAEAEKVSFGVSTEKQEVWSLPITPEMKTKALREGMPMFQKKKVLTPAQQKLRDRLAKKSAPKKTTVVATKKGREPAEVKALFKSDKTKSLKTAIGEAATKVMGKDFWDNAITNILDVMHPIRQKLTERSYRLHRLSTGVASSVEALLEHGMLKWDPSGALTTDTRKDGFFPYLRKQKIDPNKFLKWIAARRAEELEKQGREKWLTKDKRDAIYDWAAPRDDKHFEAAAKRLKEFNSSVLDVAEGAGLIDPVSRKTWEQDYYVPFYRIMEDQDAKAEFLQSPRKTGKRIDAQIKRLTGAEMTLGDPLENLLHNWTHLLNESMRNIARADAYQAGMELNSGIVEPMNKEDLKDFQPEKDGRIAYAPKGETQASVLMFQRRGKPVYFKVNDEMLYDALAYTGPHQFGNIMKLFSIPKRALTYGATFSGAFRAANMLRDTLHTSALDPNFKPFTDSIVGMVKEAYKDQDSVNLLASGGSFAGSYTRADDPKATAKYLKKIMKKEGRGALKWILDSPAKAKRAWDWVGSVSEQAARVRGYEKKIKAGMSHMDAAYESRDYLDFAQHGKWKAVQMLIQVLPFLNARLQGNYKLARAGDPRKSNLNRRNFYITAGSIMAASMALWGYNRDDDRYKALEPWDRRSYWHVFGPEGTDVHIRIPKPFELGALFGTIPESMLDALHGNEETKYIAKTVWHTAMETFAMNPIPQAAKPIIEEVVNMNFFTGRQVVGQRLQRKPYGEQADPWTSDTAKLIGKATGIPPKRFEHVVRGYGSVFGMFLLGVTDFMIHNPVFNPMDIPESPSMQTDRYPIVGRFLREEPPSNTKHQTWFYDLMDELNKGATHIKELREEGKMDEADAYEKRTGITKGEQRKANKIRLRISRKYTKMREIWERKDLNAKEKREELDRLTRERNKMLKDYYDEYYVKRTVVGPIKKLEKRQ